MIYQLFPQFNVYSDRELIQRIRNFIKWILLLSVCMCLFWVHFAKENVHARQKYKFIAMLYDRNSMREL